MAIISDGGKKVEYEGAVLGEYERNGYNDSDFYAVVWDAEAGRIKDVLVWSTAWAGGGGIVVDATDEAKAAALAWYDAEAAKGLADGFNAEARLAEKGKVVKVVKGRKAKGAVGEVFWTGVDQYKSGRWGDSYRVGLVTEGGEKVFVPMEYVEVVDPVLATADQFAGRQVALPKRPLDSLSYNALHTVGIECLVEMGYKSHAR